MKLSLKTRVLGTVLLATILCTSAALFVAAERIRSQGETDLVDKSRAVLSRLEAARNYVAQQGHLKSVVDETIRSFPDAKLPHDQVMKILKNVPIFASMMVGNEGAKEEHYDFRVFAENARKKENEANEQERKWLARFKTEPGLREIVEISPDRSQLYVVRPVHLSESQNCLVCHGHPSTSPWKNGKDILGFPMEDMKDGALKGAFAIVSSLEPVKAASNSAIGSIALWSGVFAALACLAAFLGMRNSLSGILGIARDLGRSSVEVSSASEQLSTASQQLSSGATEGAASLEETVASLEEVSHRVRQNADHAKEAEALSRTSNEAAVQGEAEIQRLIDAMGEIARGSKKIEEIIGVIDDIAFQTNLLALNAAVEAARAGEQGKGFAVVADAVRNLAQRSAAAAKDINAMIKESASRTENGSKVANESGVALKKIVGSIRRISEINSEISQASQQQSTGIAQISSAMNQLDTVTQNNAASAEEAAASSEELSAQAHLLQNMVVRLSLIIDGGERRQSNAQPSSVDSDSKAKPARLKLVSKA